MKRVWCLAWVATPALVACLDATAIDVRIYTEVPCTNPAGTVAVLAASTLDELDQGLQQSFSASRTQSCTPGTPDAYVGDVVLLPRRTDDETIAFAVMARLDGADPSTCGASIDPKCILSIQTAKFVPHRTQSACVHLRTSCAGAQCGTQACVDGACVDPPLVTASSCP